MTNQERESSSRPRSYMSRTIQTHIVPIIREKGFRLAEEGSRVFDIHLSFKSWRRNIRIVASFSTYEYAQNRFLEVYFVVEGFLRTQIAALSGMKHGMSTYPLGYLIPLGISDAQVISLVASVAAGHYLFGDAFLSGDTSVIREEFQNHKAEYCWVILP